jgi:hypothetical protein
MSTLIKLRRDTAANWAATDPVLQLGEPGYDTTNNQLRIGNGTTPWSGLTPIAGGGEAGLPLSNGTSNFNIATASGNATVTTAGAYTWTFDTTGNLTIPNDIVSSTTIDIDNRASGNSADIQLFAADDILLQARDRTLGSGTEGGDINILAGDSAEDGDSSGGDVTIRAGDGGAANVDFGGAGGTITIQSGRGGAAIGNTGATAESGGSLTLSAGDAGDNNGNIALGADGGDVFIESGFSTGNTNNGGDIVLTTGTGGQNGASGNVQINIPGYGLTTGGTWTFDATGNLTLPNNTFAVNYANGTPVSIGGGDANTGNVTFSDQIVIGTGTNDGGGGLYLAPGNASIANSAVQYLRVRGGDYPTHIHLDTGNNEYYDQYFGADSRYVKLEANGNIVINADDYNGNSASWNFNVDSNLTVPGNIQSVTTGFPFSSNISGINTGSPTVLVTLTDSVFSDPETGQVTITGVVGTTEANNTWYYLSIDPSNFQLYNDSALTNPVDGTEWTAYVSDGLAVALGYSNLAITGGNVSIVTNTGNTWTFDADGYLTVPGAITRPVNETLLLVTSGNTGNTSSISIDGEVGRTLLRTYDGTTLNTWELDVTGNLNLPANGDINFDGGGIAQALNEDIYIRASDDESDGWSIYNVVDDGAGNILSQTRLEFDQYTVRTDAQGAGYTWAFRDTGVLELPGDIYGNVGGNLTIKIGDSAGSDTFIDLQTRSYVGDALISNIRIANPNVTVSTANAAYNWTFDGTGNLTVPGNSIVSTADATGGAGGNSITIQAGAADQSDFFDTPGGNVNINGGLGAFNDGGGGGPGGDVNINSGLSSDPAGHAGNVNIGTGTNGWTFDYTGNVTLPQGGVVYETNIPFGGLSGKTIALKPYGGTDGDQQLFVYPTAGVDANHLHLTSGNLYNTELFLGNDDLYVKLANTGNVVINSNDGVGNTAQWTFSTTGVATLPGEGILQSINDTVTLRSFNTSTGNANSVYLGTSGGLGFNDGEIGGNWLEIFRNGAEPEIRVPVGLGNLNIQTASGNTPYNWTFDDTGNLTLPGSIIMAPNSGIIANGASPAPSLSGFNSLSAISVSASGNISATGNVTASSLNGNANISNVTINSYASVPKLWFKGQLSAAQNIVSSTDTVTLWNSNSDPLSWGNVSTGHIVPDKAGWYEITSRVQFDTNAAANSQNQINHQIAVNGSQQAISQLPNLTGNVPVTMITTAMVELNGTTDYITTTSWSSIAGNAQQINGSNASMVLVRWVSGS